MAISSSGAFYLTFRDIYLNDTAVDMVADAITMALYTNSITPNFDTNTGKGAAPFNANEVGTATALTSPAFSVIATNKLKYTSSPVAFPSATFTGARGGLLFDDTITTPVADPVLVLLNFGADFGVTAGVLTVTPHTDGWWNRQLT
jgi:hypothetical protein